MCGVPHRESRRSGWDCTCMCMCGYAARWNRAATSIPQHPPTLCNPPSLTTHPTPRHTGLLGRVHQAGGLQRHLHGHRVPTEQVRLRWFGFGSSVCLSIAPSSLGLGGRSVLSCLWVAVDGSIDSSSDIRIIHLLPLSLFLFACPPPPPKQPTNQPTNPPPPPPPHSGARTRARSSMPTSPTPPSRGEWGGWRPPCLPACIFLCLPLWGPPSLSVYSCPYACPFAASRLLPLSLCLCLWECLCLCVYTYAR